MARLTIEGVEGVADVDRASREVTRLVASLPRPLDGLADRLGLVVACTSTALRYGFTVYPCVVRELARWRSRALEIPDPDLGRLALDALRKRGNMEGAALFAVFAPRGCRAEAVRALVAFQAAYNYLDMLSEQRSADPVQNARQLHAALAVALDPAAPHLDYYAGHPTGDDGGYLRDMVDACRASLGAMPSYRLVARSAQAAAARIVTFQSLNVGGDGLELWGREHSPSGSGLAWWETAAAAGSSLAVHVLIGLSASDALTSEDVAAVDAAYFPSIGALHSLLDSVVDVGEDQREGQRNLLSYYSSTAHAAARLGCLAQGARLAARTPADGHRHEAVLTAMVCHYLSAREASAPPPAIVDSVTAALGGLVKPALALFRAWRSVRAA